MKKRIVVLLILVALILIVFVVTYINNSKDNETGAKENQDNEITGNIVKEDSENEGISGSVVESGAADDIESSLENPENLKNLPADLYTKPCGHYFLKYKVCAGVCPGGQCLVDRNSCYCKGDE